MRAPDARPLAGVVVVDLTRVLAGPYCTLVLSNLGARVIKVERPPDGDDARGIGPFVGGKSLYFSALNHGKESSPSTSGTATTAPSSRGCSTSPMCWSRTSVRACSIGWATAGRAAGAMATPRVRRGVGVRSHGSAARAPRLRHGGPGHGWHHEPHRLSRRTPGTGRGVHRRHRRGALPRRRRLGRPRATRRVRSRRDGRRRHARLPARHPRERPHHLPGHRRGAAPARHASPAHRTVTGLRGRRRQAARPLRGARHASLRAVMPSNARSWPRTHASSPPMPDAGTSTSCRRSSRRCSARVPRPSGSTASRAPAFRAAR